jgi:hypothetical protein
VKERLKLQNLRIDHVTIRSELKYLIEAKNLGMQWPGLEVEPGPNATVRGFHVVKLLQRFGSGSNPNPELFKLVGTVANTTRKYTLKSNDSRNLI